jgi:hypothetical protein
VNNKKKDMFYICFYRPQVSGTSPSPSQQPSTTAKYYVRSELKQFAKYLTGFYLF